MTKKVLFLDSVHPILSERLTESLIDCVYALDKDIDFIYDKYSDVFGIVLRSRFFLDAEVLSRFKNLRFVARAGSG